MRNIKKILLIHPTLTVDKIRLSDVWSFPLGLLYIASVLVKNGYEVEILDCIAEDTYNVERIDSNWFRFGLAEKNIIKRIETFKPDLVGVSIPFSCQYADALRIGSIIKALNSQIITVAGGVHVTVMPESISSDYFDYCIIGEGEFGLLNLVNSINHGSPENIAGVVTKDDMRSGNNSISAPFIEPLDILPYPQYNLLPLERYWSLGARWRWVHMIASRGCSFDCNFCSVHSVMGRKLRLRSVDNIIGEIELLKRRFDVNEIRFEDDGLTDNMEWAKELFRKIASGNFGMRFCVRNGIRADTVDKEMLLLMKKAGFETVVFSPESGSQRTLDNIIQKRVKLETIESSIIMAKETGLSVHCFLIIGFPEETKEDIAKTIKYGYKLQKLGVDSIWVSCATPYPKTRLFEECVRKRIIDKNNIDFRRLSTLDPVIYNDSFSAEEVKKIRVDAMRVFYKQPKAAALTQNIISACKCLCTNPKLVIEKIKHKAIFMIKKYIWRIDCRCKQGISGI